MWKSHKMKEFKKNINKKNLRKFYKQKFYFGPLAVLAALQSYYGDNRYGPLSKHFFQRTQQHGGSVNALGNN